MVRAKWDPSASAARSKSRPTVHSDGRDRSDLVTSSPRHSVTGTRAPRGFEDEPSDEWREEYGRGGPVRSDEPERDWFFEQSANSNSEAKPTEPISIPTRAKREPVSYRGLGPKGYRPRDERIQELLCERLTEHPGIDASDITLEVECGIVRVQGTVPIESMKHAAIQAIRGSIGVIGVLDQIEIGGQHSQ